MEEEGVPSTTLREISLLKMLSESNHIVKSVSRTSEASSGP
jgi:cyclin-dependent kinase